MKDATTNAPPFVRITPDTVHEQYEFIFAPWVKAMGLTRLAVAEAHVTLLTSGKLVAHSTAEFIF